MASGLAWETFKLLTFDCYGTLVDWESGILGILKPWAAAHRISVADDVLLAAYAEAETKAEHALPTSVYREILRETMEGIAEQFGKSASQEEKSALANSVGDWHVFPDTVESLQSLKNWHKLMVVSNVDKISFSRTAPKLGVALDGLVTAEEVGAYKPDRRMFERALKVAKEMGIKREEVLHVAQSLYHDVVPAKALGLKTVWVDRRGGRSGGASLNPTGDAAPHLRVVSLRELVQIQLEERE
jgi:2-haloacid dehalogenase